MSSSDDDAPRVRRPTAAFMEQYLRGPSRKVAKQPQAAAPLAVDAEPAPPARTRRDAQPLPAGGRVAAVQRAEVAPRKQAVKAAPSTVKTDAVSLAQVKPVAERPRRAAAVAVEQAAPRMEETILMARRPTRPVSPVGGSAPRRVATLGAAFSAALFGSGAHSPAGSFTPSESSEDEDTRRRRGGQHFHGMAAPPSILNDEDDEDEDGGTDDDDASEAPGVQEEEYTYSTAMGAHVPAAGRGAQQTRSDVPPPPASWQAPQQHGNGTAWDEQEDGRGSRGSGSSRSEFTASSEGEPPALHQRAPPAPPSAAPQQQQRSGGAVWRVPDVSPGVQVLEDRRSVLLLIDPKPKGAAEWRPLVAAASEAGHLSVAVVTSTGGGPQAAAALAARKEADFAHVLCGSTHDHGALFGLAADILNAAQLGGFIPVAVLPGSQEGALGCDTLAATLGLPHNRLDTVLARRDKALACDIIHGAGLAAPPGGRARWPDDAWRVGRAHGFPLVIRDVLATSAPGSPAAWRCDTEASSGAAVGAAMELSKDPSQRTRRCVLVQPLLRGSDQFMVSIFAAPRSGPRVTALWHFQPHASAGDAFARAHAALSGEGAADTAPRRAGGTPSCPYDQAVLVDATAPVYASLVAYALAACDALGWAVGVAHLKLRATAVTSPSGALRFTDHIMVAFNPWAAPGGFDALAAKAMGGSGGDSPVWNPFAATLAAATRQEGDDAAAPLLHLMPPQPRPGLHARVVYVAVPPGGTLVAWEGEAAVMRLPSFVSHTLLAKPGSQLQEAPQPCRNAVAAVRLLHSDPRVVEQDARAVWSHLRCVVKPGGGRATSRGQCAQQ